MDDACSSGGRWHDQINHGARWDWSVGWLPGGSRQASRQRSLCRSRDRQPLTWSQLLACDCNQHAPSVPSSNPVSARKHPSLGSQLGAKVRRSHDGSRGRGGTLVTGLVPGPASCGATAVLPVGACSPRSSWTKSWWGLFCRFLLRQDQDTRFPAILNTYTLMCFRLVFSSSFQSLLTVLASHSSINVFQSPESRGGSVLGT